MTHYEFVLLNKVGAELNREWTTGTLDAARNALAALVGGYCPEDGDTIRVSVTEDAPKA